MIQNTGSLRRRYFDWAATAEPLLPAENAYNPLSFFGNPSSPHAEGRKAREALESARSRCAGVLGIPAENLYFTSGGSESNALIVHSLIRRCSKARVLYSAVEHPSVRENCLVLEKLGLETAPIPVGTDGRVSLPALEKLLGKYPDTRFAAIMAANNEIGSLMDMSALSKIIRGREGAPVHFHSDLVQAIGKVPVDVKGWDLDSASFSAHKIGGPRGIGFLYLRKTVDPLYTGGGQEKGIRPGTENTAGALAMADCLERRLEDLESSIGSARERFSCLIRGLRERERCVLIPGDREEDDPRFSPWILQVRFRDVPGEVMVRALDDSGIAVSTGSACSSSSPERPVLDAMGLDEGTRLEGIRISQGWTTGMEDIEALLKAVDKVLTFL